MICGVIFLDKPAGWTSRRAVNEMVRRFSGSGKKIRAGHAGTLDPLATGMLPIFLGEATRFASYGLDGDKSYEFTVDFSRQTDTLDCEGQVVSRHDCSGLDVVEVRQAIDSVKRSVVQIPPAYSAIRIEGKRAYEMARRGKTPDLAPRPVRIHELRLLHADGPRGRFFVRCSKGTYVRALARDLGALLGLGGCVTELRRIGVGCWPASVMCPPEKADDACLLPVEQWLQHLPSISLTLALGKRFVQGQRIPLQHGEKGEVRVYCDDMFLGTGQLRNGMGPMVLHPSKVLPSAIHRLLQSPGEKEGIL